MPELSVKTFLPLANGQNDIRKFTTRSEEVTFAYLLEKIRAVYELQPDSFRILWKDADGDAVTIANDDDFISMLKNSGDSLKLNIQRNVSTAKAPPQPTPMEQGTDTNAGSCGGSQASAPEDPDLHAGITCDGCNVTIRGIRYKCLECADYDLCAQCETKNLHNEHLTLKIPKPKMPGVMPIVLLSRALCHARDMAAQGKTACHNAMGAMPNPQDYVDLSLLGQQLCTMLHGLGVDASYFIQPPFGPGGAHTCPPRCTSTPGCACPPCAASSAAATAALERRITETLEHLRAMGFQDENGSLTNLVRSKKGDLFAVLDILKAQQSQ